MNAFPVLLTFFLCFSAGFLATADPDSSVSCQCNYNTVWNDVIFLFDASEATRAKGLEEMWGAVQTMLSWFNVQNSSYTESNLNMRVGIISYASTIKVVSKLGEWDGKKVEETDTLPFFEGDYGTNIRGAVVEAMQEFNGPNHRSGSRKVIVLMATAFDPLNWLSPQQASEIFTEDGGVFMVYDYIQKDGEWSDLLPTFATEGYYFSNLNNSLADLQNAMCDANCFCLPNFASFADSIRNVPLSGCYTSSEIQNNFKTAMTRCSNFHEGVIASDESLQKTAFLSKQYLKKKDYWIGLIYNTTVGWHWSDGTPLDFDPSSSQESSTQLTGNYAPWHGGSPPTVNQDQMCVVMSTDQQWVATDCRNGYIYTCQTAPCDSTRFC